jgi:hypothetical protein
MNAYWFFSFSNFTLNKEPWLFKLLIFRSNAFLKVFFLFFLHLGAGGGGWKAIFRSEKGNAIRRMNTRFIFKKSQYEFADFLHRKSLMQRK